MATVNVAGGVEIFRALTRSTEVYHRLASRCGGPRAMPVIGDVVASRGLRPCMRCRPPMVSSTTGGGGGGLDNDDTRNFHDETRRFSRISDHANGRDRSPGQFLAVPGRDVFHRLHTRCGGSRTVAVDTAEVVDRGLRPCLNCRPDINSSTEARAAPTATAATTTATSTATATSTSTGSSSTSARVGTTTSSPGTATLTFERVRGYASFLAAVAAAVSGTGEPRGVTARSRCADEIAALLSERRRGSETVVGEVYTGGGDDAETVRKTIELLACPITHETLVDPVVTPGGHTYSRVALEEWLARNEVCPMTRRRLRMAACVRDDRVSRCLEALWRHVD